ncbi:VOC family protein [bacterium]|nr:MAG: VOC family protein [bacterium]
MNLNSVHHIAIIVSDYEKSKKFYTEVLGFKIINETYRSERNSYKLDLVVNNQTQIELFSFPNPPSRPSYPEAAGLRHIAFSADSISKVRNELISKNVEAEEIRTDETANKQFFFFADPDGLPIEIYEK